MQNKKEQRPDRRSLYTKQAVKKAFLQLKEKKDFNSITVSDICRTAKISRSTFYLHYNHTAEVLDEVLDDAAANVRDLMDHLSDTENGQPSRCSYPLCKFIRESHDYQCIFFDDSLTGRIIKKLSGIYMERFVEGMKKHTRLSRTQLEALFCFHINGCFAVSKQFAGLNEEKWCPVQQVIDQFIKSGIDRFSGQFALFCAESDKK